MDDIETILRADFWSKVDVDQSSRNGCWEWQSSLNEKGYGRFRKWKAHRFSWSLHFGDPGNLMVCHHCDNPKCVRPDHLFLGTALDNNLDRMRKGRPNGALGVRNVNAKLSDVDVRTIRAALAMGRRGAHLAEEYAVSQTVIHRIKHGLAWTHVPAP